MSGKSSMAIDKALFETALDIADPVAREEFLVNACGADVARKARVKKLLGAAEAADDFFRAASEARVDVVEQTAQLLARISLESKTPGSGDGPGSRIGPYALLERIGEGGWGAVYLAEQCEPVRRRVALKIIRLGLDTEKVVARFQMERQALALMDHPNIARVLDAGATESGRPYFVMELVQGARITEHCDSRRLGLRQRLELFIQVCQAIQHAHQKGIIHRDIKPSNILMSSRDGLAVPKVIDFGIVLAIEGRLAEHTPLTICDQFMGTPAYMSPEQAEGGHDVDTRSDVYSLGVLLCELLSGATPFDGKKLAQAGIFEMLRILREEEPPAPSGLIAGINADQLNLVAARRGTDPRQLTAAVRGDLDWIVLKALAKDRRSRYDTAIGLAMDVRRFLDDEPVMARPPGRLYLLGKLVRRNKALFASAAAVVLALMAGLVVSSWFYIREREARRVQVKLRETAEVARAEADRLLSQSNARESVSQAAILLAEGKVQEADALLAKTSLTSIEPSLEAANVFRALGDWNAIRQRWRQAADCYTLFLMASRGGRASTMPATLTSILAIGPALVEAEAFGEYREFRDESLAREGRTTDPINAAMLVKACLLVPTDPLSLERLRPSANLLAATLAREGAVDAYQGAFAAMSLGMMEYRRGNFSQALEWNRRCEAFPNKNQARSAAIHAVSAMAAHRLGKFALARSELTQSREILSGPFAKGEYYPRGKDQGHWFDWAIAGILEREATALVEQTGGAARVSERLDSKQ